MIVVLSLGGSVLMGEGFNAERVREFAEVIERISENHRVFVVVGGGRIAREYINAARELGADETYCDYMGIEVTRLNAMLLAGAIKKAPKFIPHDFKSALELSCNHDVVVMGGTFPGHTTDATSALLAEFAGADILLNATSVDGVYSDDPKKSRDAIKYDKLTFKQLVDIVSGKETSAGVSNVLDLLAAKIIERSKIKTVIFLGTPENIERAVRGEEIGTVVFG
jgi:uridylate kinase